MKHRTLVLAVAGLVTFCGAVIATLLVVVPRELVADLSAQVEAVTNRPITVDGSSRLSLFPEPVAVLDNVSFSGRSGQPLIGIERVSARVRFLPLLMGRVEAHALELDRPSVDLVIAEDGTINWAIYEGNEFDDVSVANPRIGTVRVTNGVVRYRNVRTGRSHTITDVNGEIEWPRFLAPARVVGSAGWNGETFTIDALTQRPVDLMFDGASAADVAFSNRFASGRIDGQIQVTDTFGFDGNLDIAVGDLQSLARWAGVDATGGLFPKTVDIRSQLNVRGRQISFENAALDIEGQRADGALSLDLSKAVPPVKGTLAFDIVNLDTLLARSGLVSGDGDAPAAEGFDRAAPAALVSPDHSIDLRVSAGRLAVAGLIVSDVALALTVEDGRADIGLGNAGLAGGNVAGTGTIDTSLRPPKTTISAGANGIVLGKAADSAFRTGWLAGTVDLSVDLAATGESWAEILAATRGAIDVRVADGTFGLSNTVRLVSPGLPGVVGTIAEQSLRRRARSIPFQSAGLNIVVESGRARVSDISLTGPVATIAGAGMISLSDGTIAFNLDVAAPEAGERPIPVDLAGTVGRPVASTDLAALARLVGGR